MRSHTADLSILTLADNNNRLTCNSVVLRKVGHAWLIRSLLVLLFRSPSAVLEFSIDEGRFPVTFHARGVGELSHVTSARPVILPVYTDDALPVIF